MARIYILNTGYLETDRNCVVACGAIGTRSKPHIENTWIQLPVMAFLIETEEGYILYDTGSNPEAMNGHWPKTMQEIYPLYQKDEERLENQLKLCGVAPEEIKTVVLSHMHLDHAGNIPIEKVRALEKKYNAKVIFAHDSEFFKTLKLAPEYYG